MHDPGATLTAAILSSGYAPCARLVSLDGPYGSDAIVWQDDDAVMTSASVTDDRGLDVRRGADISVADPTGALSPLEVGDPFAVGSWLRLDRGARIGNLREWMPIATLVVSGYGSAMAGALTIRASDPLWLLRQPFGAEVSIGAGTAAADALRTLWAPVLDPDGGGAGWPLEDGGRVCPLRVFLEDEDRLGAVLELVRSLGLQVYADRLGRPVMEVAPDPSDVDAVATVREYEPGAAAALLDLTRSSDRRPFNRVVVESSPDDDSQPLRATVDITDPTSPLHPDRIGIQAAPIYRLPGVRDLASLGAAGTQLLIEYALATDTTSGTALPDPRLDAGDVVRIQEPTSGTDARYRLERVTHPVLPGSMSLDASRVVPVTLLA